MSLANSGGSPPEIDEMLHLKQSELKELNLLRIKTLEKIIEEKVQTAEEAKRRLKQRDEDYERLNVMLAKRDQIVEQYEVKFAELRDFVARKDAQSA